MSLKDLLKKISKILLVIGIVLISLGGVICFTGLGAITGIPMVVLGIFIINSKKYLDDIVAGGNVSQNLFLYFTEVKKLSIVTLIVLGSILITLCIGYFYFNSLLNNIIF